MPRPGRNNLFIVNSTEDDDDVDVQKRPKRYSRARYKSKGKTHRGSAVSDTSESSDEDLEVSNSSRRRYRGARETKKLKTRFSTYFHVYRDYFENLMFVLCYYTYCLYMLYYVVLVHVLYKKRKKEIEDKYDVDFLIVGDSLNARYFASYVHENTHNSFILVKSFFNTLKTSFPVEGIDNAYVQERNYKNELVETYGSKKLEGTKRAVGLGMKHTNKEYKKERTRVISSESIYVDPKYILESMYLGTSSEDTDVHMFKMKDGSIKNIKSHWLYFLNPEISELYYDFFKADLRQRYFYFSYSVVLETEVSLQEGTTRYGDTYVSKDYVFKVRNKTPDLNVCLYDPSGSRGKDDVDKNKAETTCPEGDAQGEEDPEMQNTVKLKLELIPRNDTIKVMFMGGIIMPMGKPDLKKIERELLNLDLISETQLGKLDSSRIILKRLLGDTVRKDNRIYLFSEDPYNTDFDLITQAIDTLG